MERAEAGDFCKKALKFRRLVFSVLYSFVMLKEVKDLGFLPVLSARFITPTLALPPQGGGD
jgi:hypothetical protein